MGTAIWLKQLPVAIFNNMSGNNGTAYLVTALTAAGCEAGDDINIKVFIKPDLYVPTAFTPNGNGLNDFFCSHTGWHKRTEVF